jgi:hypothetical protein
MEYPRETLLESPFEYSGYSIQVLTYEGSPRNWMGSYRVSLGIEIVLQAAVANVFDNRPEALEHVRGVAKFRTDELDLA